LEVDEMNDNDKREASILALGFWPLVRAGNIAANGRWCVLLLAAICLARDDMRGAFLMALVLGACAIIEQIPNETVRRIAIYAVYAWVFLFMLVLLIIL
jgi:hypothetical protein